MDDDAGDLASLTSSRVVLVAALHRLADVLVDLGDHERARDLWQTILGLDPGNARATRLLASTNN